MRTLKSSIYYMLFFALGISFTQCKNDKKTQSYEMEVPLKEKISIIKSEFGKLPDSTVIDRYVLKNDNGLELVVITYGGIITSLKVPNKDGSLENIVLGFDNLVDYLRPNNPYFGALIGRYGNRIAKGKFTLNGIEYNLAINNGVNHLHGGIKGFDRVVWNVEPMESQNGPSLKLKYLSKDGEEGYPGNLNVTVVYALTNNNTLEVIYKATTDKQTVINLTQHAYFNLSGDFSKTILDHEITINSDSYLSVDDTLIPTGELANVSNTPFDFRTAKTIGRDIENENDQLKKGKGYDHCWVLKEQGKGLGLAASAYHPESKRLMEIFTDEPGIQFYTGNFLNGTLPIPNGGTYAQRTGFCMETQHFPDSPNQKDFPSVVLNPGDTYKTKTTFKFSIK